jgi:lactoylglutathione lyase
VTTANGRTHERVDHLADADDRSVLSCIRRAVERELQTAEQSPGNAELRARTTPSTPRQPAHSGMDACAHGPGCFGQISTDHRTREVGAVTGQNPRVKHVPPAESRPLFQKIDCLALPVPDLEAAVAFYASLGHELKWRTPQSAAFQLPDSNAELIVMTDRTVRETDIAVESADDAVERFIAAGGRLVKGPFDIAIGRCAVVADPWDNLPVLLDNSNGFLTTDAEGNVTGVSHRDQAP